MKRLKAFTLIECLIAMFILGISSLLLCQGYTQLMKITNRTSTINASIGQQTKNAEQGNGSSDSNSTLLQDKQTMQVKLVSEGFDYDAKGDKVIKGSVKSSVESRDYDTTSEYNATISIYEVKGYNYDPSGNGTKPFSDEKKDGSEMRYIYFAQ